MQRKTFAICYSKLVESTIIADLPPLLLSRVIFPSISLENMFSKRGGPFFAFKMQFI